MFNSIRPVQLKKTRFKTQEGKWFRLVGHRTDGTLLIQSTVFPRGSQQGIIEY